MRLLEKKDVKYVVNTAVMLINCALLFARAISTAAIIALSVWGEVDGSLFPTVFHFTIIFFVSIKNSLYLIEVPSQESQDYIRVVPAIDLLILVGEPQHPFAYQRHQKDLVLLERITVRQKEIVLCII
jgi:hypothetical protein